MVLSSAVAFLIFSSTAITSGLAGYVAWADGREHRLGLAGGDVAFGATRQELSQQGLESAYRLDATTGECLAPVCQHPHRFELAVDLEYPQVRGADGYNSNRVSVVGVGLAVVAGVEEPHPGGELGRHVDDLLAGLE